MPDSSEIAALFRQMAERIERNAAEEFGGALLVIPPIDQNGQVQPIDALLIGSTKDPANFWAMALGKVQIAASVFEEKARQMERGAFR